MQICHLVSLDLHFPHPVVETVVDPIWITVIGQNRLIRFDVRIYINENMGKSIDKNVQKLGVCFFRLARLVDERSFVADFRPINIELTIAGFADIHRIYICTFIVIASGINHSRIRQDGLVCCKILFGVETIPATSRRFRIPLEHHLNRLTGHITSFSRVRIVIACPFLAASVPLPKISILGDRLPGSFLIPRRFFCAFDARIRL